MAIGYGSADKVSTDGKAAVPWRLALATLALTFIVIVAGISAIALGVGNPPYAAQQVLSVTTLDGFSPVALSPGLSLRLMGKTTELPLTIEARLLNRGAEDSAWGFWLGGTSREGTLFLIDRQGFVSVSAVDRLDWQPFLHVKPADNRLYLHIDHGREATLRVNGEIAWTGEVDLPPDSAFGMLTLGDPQLIVEYVRFYSG